MPAARGSCDLSSKGTVFHGEVLYGAYLPAPHTETALGLWRGNNIKAPEKEIAAMADTTIESNPYLCRRDESFQPPAPTANTLVEAVRMNPTEFGLTMAQLVTNQWGPLPIGAQFPMHGGTLVVSFSASVHTDQPIPSGSLAQVGYDIAVDGTVVGSAITFVWAQDVWTNCATTLIVNNLSPATHTITIQPHGPYTSNDQFNLFNLTVMEF